MSKKVNEKCITSGKRCQAFFPGLSALPAQLSGASDRLAASFICSQAESTPAPVSRRNMRGNPQTVGRLVNEGKK
jgi:hypothetical protein